MSQQMHNNYVGSLLTLIIYLVNKFVWLCEDNMLTYEYIQSSELKQSVFFFPMKIFLIPHNTRIYLKKINFTLP